MPVPSLAISRAISIMREAGGSGIETFRGRLASSSSKPGLKSSAADES